jgi:glutaredoxin
MLKKVLFVAAIILVIQNWGYINKLINPPPDFAAEHDGKVILYATSWCGYCAKARKLLVENNIDFFEYDIEKSTEGHRQYKAVGGRGIPVLLINGEVVKGYNPKLILELARPT